MILTEKDIDDIAKGYHNRYVEAQDKNELIKYLASKVKDLMKQIEDFDYDETT